MWSSSVVANYHPRHSLAYSQTAYSLRYTGTVCSCMLMNAASMHVETTAAHWLVWYQNVTHHATQPFLASSFLPSFLPSFCRLFTTEHHRGCMDVIYTQNKHIICVGVVTQLLLLLSCVSLPHQPIATVYVGGRSVGHRYSMGQVVWSWGTACSYRSVDIHGQGSSVIYSRVCEVYAWMLSSASACIRYWYPTKALQEQLHASALWILISTCM